MPTIEAPPKAPIPGHVPVEHRFLGLDRRTIPLALVVFGIMAVFLWVFPAIDRAVQWDDETKAGDVIDLGDGVTIVPPVGWELTNGIRVSDDPITGVSSQEATAAFGNGGVAITVERSGFDGSPGALLDQVNRLRSRSDSDVNRSFKVTGPRQTITTDSGITGVSEAYTSANGEGRMLAFTIPGGGGAKPGGVVITVDGSADEYAAQSKAIDAVIASLAAKGSDS